MSSNITKTRTIRLPNDVVDFIDRENDRNPIRSVLESLYENITSGKLELHDGEIKIPDLSRCVPTDIIADFNEILNLYGLDVGEFVKVMYEKIANFDLDVEELIK